MVAKQGGVASDHHQKLEEVQDLPGMKKIKVTTLVAVVAEGFPLWSKYSCYNKLVRIVAWLLKFYRACRDRAKTAAAKCSNKEGPWLRL